MNHVTHGRLSLCAAAILALPSIVSARPCSELVENRSCEVDIARKDPVAPLPYRVRKDAKAQVIIRVERKPLEKVTFEETISQVAETDVLAVIAGKLFEPLKSLLITVSASSFATIPNSALRSIKGGPMLQNWQQYKAPGPAPNVCDQEFERLCRSLLEVQTTHAAEHQNLDSWQTGARGVPTDVKNIQGQALPPLAGVLSQALLDTQNLLGRLGCDATASTAMSCVAPSPVPPCGPGAPLVACSMPSAKLAKSGAQLDVIRGELSSLSGAYNKPGYAPFVAMLTETLADQRMLESELARLSAAQADLKALRDALAALNPVDDFTQFVERKVGSRSISASSVTKISITDVVSKKTTAAPAVTVQWTDLPWEYSTGLWYSSLDKRSYSVAPVIVNGQQTVVDTVKQTYLRETTSSPNIVPGVFVHYRILEGTWKGRRSAALLTVGAGVNNGAVEFAVGPTFAWGSFMLSPVVHIGRDVELTNGLTVNQPNPPADISGSQKRKWTHKFGFGLSVKVAL